VLLGAGVAPASAWRHVCGPDPPSWVVGIADAALADPHSIADAIQASARDAGVARGHTDVLAAAAISGLAAMWRVATESGAPVASALRAAASALRDAAVSARVARIALAGPRATARLVVAMPAVAVVFGALLGYDTVGVLLGSPIGWACLALGSGLMVIARLWSARLIAKAAVVDPMPGLSLDLLAVALSGGGSVRTARSIVDLALRRSGLGTTDERADAMVDLASAVGIPIGELLRAEADDVRRASAASAAERAAALETALMLPLGVCVLPAFVVLGVVPLLVAVMSSTVAIL
jgi:tight adherence protein B